MREVKQGLKRMEKLMNTLASLNTAIQLMLNESHNIEGVMLVLGSSPIRPQQVYEMFFSHGSFVAEHTIDYNKSKAAETLSRKAIRALVSDGAGSVSYAGPTKLFLLAEKLLPLSIFHCISFLNATSDTAKRLFLSNCVLSVRSGSRIWILQSVVLPLALSVCLLPLQMIRSGFNVDMQSKVLL
ncbi:hypothetical protein IFM89_026467 [Coptis chinensis]|uniref:Uncharacterized protein n=1 Tax=Coptis chinensis TaxID=261450 RepID=A0A835IDG3_9MAGN|nr:hypothetical protein IFM89_026467 [Coptis chinensis]